MLLFIADSYRNNVFSFVSESLTGYVIEDIESLNILTFMCSYFFKRVAFTLWVACNKLKQISAISKWIPHSSVLTL